MQCSLRPWGGHWWQQSEIWENPSSSWSRSGKHLPKLRESRDMASCCCFLSPVSHSSWIQMPFPGGGGHDPGGNGAAKKPNSLRKGNPPLQSKVLWSQKGVETPTYFLISLFFYHLVPGQVWLQQAGHPGHLFCVSCNFHGFSYAT